jgi:hypothetical protein
MIQGAAPSLMIGLVKVPADDATVIQSAQQHKRKATFLIANFP